MEMNKLIVDESKYIIKKAESILKEMEKWKDNKTFPIGDENYVEEKLGFIEIAIKNIRNCYK